MSEKNGVVANSVFLCRLTAATDYFKMRALREIRKCLILK